MGKPNFFVTAASINLGLLAFSAFSYWFSQNRSEQNDRGEDDTSAPQPSTAENVDEEERSICGVCFKEIEMNPITTLACGHKVHGHCYYQMEKDHLTCGTCSRGRPE